MEDAFTPANPLDFGQVIKTGLDGRLYVVFAHSGDLDRYMEADPNKRYAGKQVCSFGQFENAICIS